MRPDSLLLRPANTQYCTLGCPILDAFLGGGIPCNSITELVSESGCGKTQLSLQLLFTAQLPLHLNGLSGSSLYLYSEFPFPNRRFNQLLESFRLSHPILFASSRDPRDYIFTRDCQTAQDLLDVLLLLESRLEKPKETRLDIKLIVIDSIAALFRSEFENNPRDLKRRSSLFFKISSLLKSHAKRFGIAIVLTNQVVDSIEDNEGSSGIRVGNLEWLYTSGRRVWPALGLSWANCVNSRLFLSRYEVTEGVENASPDADYIGFVNRRKTRELHVVFAPHLPYSTCEFVITREGVSGVAR
ncbi:DNA repair protein XRCC3 homolog [Cynara cardunculus var. scolymus]|uniref:DNA recombination and repair protein Rad51, C-terminal n=1 Tax=Cynara cardunculus var. scolymus TaxID=59895 RepID=A0A124SI75_CYNCS|nr:DNA repair protein XRCC3 homolog [Cynara cardunculus var. scolymus]KVI11807.1 DNA recombination and repair protein Rad51, C-terminal [Cynara cardunculus var. scolymus]